MDRNQRLFKAIDDLIEKTERERLEAGKRAKEHEGSRWGEQDFGKSLALFQVVADLRDLKERIRCTLKSY